MEVVGSSMISTPNAFISLSCYESMLVNLQNVFLLHNILTTHLFRDIFKVFFVI